jgi:tetratricopeptide (TPR) repeat protein
MMRKINTRIPRQFKMPSLIGLVLLAMVVSVLSGCAVMSKTGPGRVAQEASAAKGPAVSRLTGGREGFVITEVPRMDAAARTDFARAAALLKTKEYGQAADLLQKVIKRSPGVTAPYIDVAIAYRHIGKPKQAEAALKTALRLFPDHPVASNEYGLLCRQNGRFAEARTIYEKSLARFPDYYPLHRNLGILCDIYLNDLPCALAQYQIYSKARPEDKQVKMWIADLNNRMGKK